MILFGPVRGPAPTLFYAHPLEYVIPMLDVILDIKTGIDLVLGKVLAYPAVVTWI